jgi:hypothetical protein
MVIKGIGLLMIIDGILSILWAYEPRLLWQLGRFVRIMCGVILCLI